MFCTWKIFRFGEAKGDAPKSEKAKRKQKEFAFL